MAISNQNQPKPVIDRAFHKELIKQAVLATFPKEAFVNQAAVETYAKNLVGVTEVIAYETGKRDQVIQAEKAPAPSLPEVKEKDAKNPQKE
jgi:hypothetical protein